MRSMEARRHELASVGPLLAGTGWLPLLVLMIVAGGLAAAGVMLVSTGTVEILVMAIFCLLAIVGVFFLFGWLSGFVRLNENAAETDIAHAAADGLEAGVQIVAPDGTIVFTNALGRTAFGLGTGTIEDVFAADPQAAEAIFRLTRAAERGEQRTEEIRQRPSAGTARTQRLLRIGVKPCAVPGSDGRSGGMTAWHIADITADRARESEAIARVESALAYYDTMPIGVFAMAADGRIAEINATLVGWLGMRADAPRPSLSIADLMPPDSAALVSAVARSGGGAARLDVDLVREDGRLMPVRLVARSIDRANGSGLLTVLVLDGQTQERVETGDGDGAGAGFDHFTRVLNGAPIGIATLDRSGQIRTANAAFSRMFPTAADTASSDAQTASALLARIVDTEERKAVEKALARVFTGRATAAPVEVAFGPERQDTRRLYFTSTGAGGVGDRETAILYVVDTSEQKLLELKFTQSQKMEAIGKLAGGIAHDLNNVLTVILGLSGMLLGARRPTDPGYNDMMQIMQVANRAAGMVRQLLAFSRKQKLAPETLAINDLIQDFGYSLNRLLGEKIELKHSPGRDLWYVRADRNQFEQVLMNLTVNARDAMPAGGRLSIRTKNISERDSLKLASLNVVAGEYVCVEVEDVGEGMPEDVMARIFEPFFTTKAVDKGTGLGLSTVYGIVKQTGGYVFVDSTVGKGTTFRVYLPRHIPESDAEVQAAKGIKKKEVVRDLTGTGRVLLVEDEDAVRSFAVRALQRQGYEVLEAASGVEALEVMAGQTAPIDLIVSDVIMPEMDGPTMLRELRKTHPDVRIVFISGYPDDAFKKSLDDGEEFAFLQKPFTLPQLAAKVKEEIGRV